MDHETFSGFEALPLSVPIETIRFWAVKALLASFDAGFAPPMYQLLASQPVQRRGAAGVRQRAVRTLLIVITFRLRYRGVRIASPTSLAACRS
jgi:hypothetical protein